MPRNFIPEALVTKVKKTASDKNRGKLGMVYSELAGQISQASANVNVLWAKHIGKLEDPDYNKGDGNTKTVIASDNQFADLAKRTQNLGELLINVLEAGGDTSAVQSELDEMRASLDDYTTRLKEYTTLGTPASLKQAQEIAGKVTGLEQTVGQYKKHVGTPEEAEALKNEVAAYIRHVGTPEAAAKLAADWKKIQKSAAKPTKAIPKEDPDLKKYKTLGTVKELKAAKKKAEEVDGLKQEKADLEKKVAENEKAIADVNKAAKKQTGEFSRLEVDLEKLRATHGKIYAAHTELAEKHTALTETLKLYADLGINNVEDARVLRSSVNTYEKAFESPAAALAALEELNAYKALGTQDAIEAAKQKARDFEAAVGTVDSAKHYKEGAEHCADKHDGLEDSVKQLKSDLETTKEQLDEELDTSKKYAERAAEQDALVDSLREEVSNHGSLLSAYGVFGEPSEVLETVKELERFRSQHATPAEAGDSKLVATLCDQNHQDVVTRASYDNQTAELERQNALNLDFITKYIPITALAAGVLGMGAMLFAQSGNKSAPSVPTTPSAVVKKAALPDPKIDYTGDDAFYVEAEVNDVWYPESQVPAGVEPENFRFLIPARALMESDHAVFYAKNKPIVEKVKELYESKRQADTKAYLHPQETKEFLSGLAGGDQRIERKDVTLNSKD